MAKKVLIVEDELDVLKMTKFRVEKAGYKTVIATDGQEALDQVKSEQPDLILLDYKLPIMNGIEVYKKLQENADHRTIPVLFLTASQGNEELVENMQEVGAKHIMIKPYDPKELLEKIGELIG